MNRSTKKQQVKQSRKLKKLFRKTKGFDRNSEKIPLAVAQSIKYLVESKGIEEEGIFRVSGAQVDVRNIKKKFDQGKKVDLNQVKNPHTVAGVLKLWFRELPEPLLTYELYDSFLAAIRAPEVTQRIQYLRTVIDSLPIGNRAILMVLMQFLHLVMNKSQKNKMSSQNLAIVFAPNLIQPAEQSFEKILGDSDVVNDLIRSLITLYPQVVEGKPLPPQGAPPLVAKNPDLIPIKQLQRRESKDDLHIKKPAAKQPKEAGVRTRSKSIGETEEDEGTSPKKKDANNNKKQPAGHKKLKKSKGAVKPPTKPLAKKPRKTPRIKKPDKHPKAKLKKSIGPPATIPKPSEASVFNQSEVDNGEPNTEIPSGTDHPPEGLYEDHESDDPHKPPARRPPRPPNLAKHDPREFMSTLRAGTRKLAQRLIAEQEISLDIEEIDALPAEQQKVMEVQLKHKISTLRLAKKKNTRRVVLENVFVPPGAKPTSGGGHQRAQLSRKNNNAYKSKPNTARDLSRNPSGTPKKLQRSKSDTLDIKLPIQGRPTSLQVPISPLKPEEVKPEEVHVNETQPQENSEPDHGSTETTQNGEISTTVNPTNIDSPQKQEQVEEVAEAVEIGEVAEEEVAEGEIPEGEVAEGEVVEGEVVDGEVAEGEVGEATSLPIEEDSTPQKQAATEQLEVNLVTTMGSLAQETEDSTSESEEEPSEPEENEPESHEVPPEPLSTQEIEDNSKAELPNEVQDLVNSVFSGEIGGLKNYLGTMKRMKRSERQVSSRNLIMRLQKSGD